MNSDAVLTARDGFKHTFHLHTSGSRIPMQTDNSTPPYSPILTAPVPDARADLLGALPKLRKFALSLCRRSGGGTQRADDLVQETVARALANINSFAPGSNMSGWLCTILRNEFYSQHRRRRHEIQD